MLAREHDDPGQGVADLRGQRLDPPGHDDWPADVTPAKPSHGGPARPRPGATLRGMFSIVIGKDDFGEDPLLLREEDALPGGEMRWRLVAQTDDEVIAPGAWN